MERNLLLFLLVLFPGIIFSQNPDATAPTNLSLKLGYENFRTLAQNNSPLLYISNNLVLGLDLSKQKNQTAWNLGLRLSAGSNQAKGLGRREFNIYDPYDLYGNRDSTNLEVNPLLSFARASLYYSFSWQLDQFNMYVGVKILNNFHYGALGADTWFFNQFSLSPVFQVPVFEHSKGSLNADISFPLFSFLLSQPYALDPSLPEESYFKAFLQTGSRFSSLDKFQQVNLSLNYRRRISERHQMGVSYEFMWMNDTQFEEGSLRAYSNALSIAYHF